MSDAIERARSRIDAKFGFGRAVAHDILSRNAEAKAIYGCALNALAEAEREAERWKSAYDIAHDQATTNGADLIESAAERHGLFEGTTVEMGITLMVFRDYKHSRESGFLGSGWHPTDERLRAWWPGGSEAAIRGLPIRQVIVSEWARLSRYEEALLSARQKCFRNPVWIQL